MSGISKGHFARAVREDLVNPNLLFLGTEHGVYLSLDKGDHWQSLQINLPDTPIRDLVVKDSDVVLGSHGRGFWILDDIEPLRQLSESVYSNHLTVFTPDQPAIRGLSNAAIQYFLGEEAGKVTVEILDSKGHIVDTFEGTEPSFDQKPDFSFFRQPRSTTPTTAAGLNRFEWNQRYQGAT